MAISSSMRLHNILILLLHITATAFCKSSPLIYDPNNVSAAMHHLSHEYYNKIFASLPQDHCKTGNIAVRQEWLV